MKRLITSDEATQAKGQHRRPCADCPWSRKSLNGWLGALTPEEWVQVAHGETKIDCHTKKGAQCAGSAIYRSNVCKSPRDPKVIRLEKNTSLVFASPSEFLAHHHTPPGNQ